MACRNARVTAANEAVTVANTTALEPELIFGVDSVIQANDLLQNNIQEFEWVKRNKAYPNFWGRNLTGENCLTQDEIMFLHRKGCKIAPTHSNSEKKISEEQGKAQALRIIAVAIELGIPENTAIFLEIGDTEKVSTAYLKGYAKALIDEKYIPAFKANTDANFDFDREFSRGLQNENKIFKECLIWAVAPSIAEFERIATTHVIHPENWTPYAPSGMTRNDIAIWQYGKNCHPIKDDKGAETTFNVNLIKNEKFVITKLL